MEDEISLVIGPAAEMVARASRIVVSTGAGMSRESNIPTFREAPNALWENYDAMELATPEGFERNPALVWRWYVDRRRMISEASAHAGHHALAQLETLDFDDFLLVTQNIDNLHREAGSKRLVELHGNIFRFKCFDRNHPVESLPDGDEVPPRCECGSFVRPDVVWFGEMLSRDDLERTEAAVSRCDALLVVGTSGTVYPAAGLPAAARAAGADIVEINPAETPITPLADVSIRAGARDALPRLVDAVASRRGG